MSDEDNIYDGFGEGWVETESEIEQDESKYDLAFEEVEENKKKNHKPKTNLDLLPLNRAVKRKGEFDDFFTRGLEYE